MPDKTDETYEIYAIKYGDRMGERGTMFVHGDPHDAPMAMDYYIWVIRSEQRTIVIDVGYGKAEGEGRGRSFLRSPVEGLALLDIDANEIEDVIITHMHYDHAGNLELFPKARFHIQDEEMSFVTGRAMTHVGLRHAFRLDDVLAMVRLTYGDRVVFHAGMTTLQGLVIGMVIVIAFDFVLRQTRSKVMQSVALRLDVAVGRQLFEKIMALPLRSLESRPASYWQLLFRDVEAVRNTLSGASAILCADLPFAILFLTVVFLIAWPVAWVLVIVFVIFLVLAWRSGQVVSAAAEEEKTKIISRDGLISEMIMGRSTVKALAMTDHLRPLWEDRQAEAIAQSLVRGTKTDSFVNAGHGLTMFTTVAMTTVGAVAIMNQELTIGTPS